MRVPAPDRSLFGQDSVGGAQRVAHGWWALAVFSGVRAVSADVVETAVFDVLASVAVVPGVVATV